MLRPSRFVRARHDNNTSRIVTITLVQRRVVVSLVLSSMSFALPASAAYSSAASSYDPPSWCDGHLTQVPRHGRLHLANLPTPLYRIDTGRATTTTTGTSTPTSASLLNFLHGIAGANLYIKRDDATGGIELGGNKIRKLEFLLADALAAGSTAVVTIGGVQSNHCRATASAARMVGLEPHLILRTSSPEDVDRMVGNVLVDRLVASRIYTCTPGEYGRVGSHNLVKRLCAHLEKNTATTKAYPIPVGGSNGLGSWGYVEAVHELLQQWSSITSTKQAVRNADDPTMLLHHVVFACGSGGTAAGIVVGMALAHGALDEDNDNDKSLLLPKQMPQLHAIGVCDDPDYFYQSVADIADQMGLVLSSSKGSSRRYSTTEEFIRAHLTVHQGKGRGYAQSTDEELEFVASFARSTGIVLDPVYSGKALHHFWRNVMEPDPEAFVNQNVLFWHTGGALGLYDKCQDLISKTGLVESSPCQRLDVFGKGGEGYVDISS